MWLLFKETAKGILSISFCVALFFFSIERLNAEKQDWYSILFWIFSIPLCAFAVTFYTYYTILLPSKLDEGYSSLNEIISEDYIFKKEYFIENFFIFEKRIYLDKIEKIILDCYEDDEDDIFFDLLIEYEGKKISILPGSVEKMLKYFDKNLSNFDSSIFEDDSVDFLKLQKQHPITLYEKNKML